MTTAGQRRAAARLIQARLQAIEAARDHNDQHPAHPGENTSSEE